MEFYHTYSFGNAPGTLCFWTDWRPNPEGQNYIYDVWNGEPWTMCGAPFQYSMDGFHSVWDGINGGWDDFINRGQVWHSYS